MTFLEAILNTDGVKLTLLLRRRELCQGVETQAHDLDHLQWSSNLGRLSNPPNPIQLRVSSSSCCMLLLWRWAHTFRLSVLLFRLLLLGLPGLWWLLKHNASKHSTPPTQSPIRHTCLGKVWFRCSALMALSSVKASKQGCMNVVKKLKQMREEHF